MLLSLYCFFSVPQFLHLITPSYFIHNYYGLEMLKLDIFNVWSVDFFYIGYRLWKLVINCIIVLEVYTLLLLCQASAIYKLAKHQAHFVSLSVNMTPSLGNCIHSQNTIAYRSLSNYYSILASRYFTIRWIILWI